MVGVTSEAGSAAQQEKHVHKNEELKKTGGLSEKFHDLKVNAIHLKHKVGKFQNLVNTNHRHDEEHEKRTDAKRTRVAEGHRFQSFAPERDGNHVKWYIDGRDYFYAVSVALERAKETIYIADWWLSPELFLRRPPYYNQQWRLDYTLKRAAERGVKIYVIVYREVEAAVTCNSAHTKHALTALCPEGTPGYGNIKVMRHPDHNVLENASDMTFYWAHHEKFIVIDYDLAFIGGLDLCFGRWDNRQHVLADAHPSGARNEMFPGQDFNNNRIMDFQSVEDWRSNEVSKADFGRMPWHDVAMGLIGPCIYDIAEHFVLRWNFCKRDKYKRDERYDWLTLAGRTGDDEDLVGVQRPKHPVGDYIHHPLSQLEHKRGNPYQNHTKQHPEPNPVGDAVQDTAQGAERDAAETAGEEYHDAQETLDEHGYRSDQHRLGYGFHKVLHKQGQRLPGNSKANEAGVVDQENPKATGNDPKREGFVTASGGVHEKHEGYSSNLAGAEIDVGHGTIHAQLVRSSADWSSGILTEQSIQNAYCQVIRQAKHYVYIENQFFITATGDKQAPVHNLIGAAIVDACVAAAKENRKFRVIIIIPTIPGFAGDLRSDAATGTRAIMDYQYKSICRGEESIYGKIKAAGFDPTNYIFMFNLRSYDRLNKTPALKEREEKTGVSYQELQRAQAEEVMPEQVNQPDDENASGSETEDKKKDGHGFMSKLKSLGKSRKSKDKSREQHDGPSEGEATLNDKRRRFEEAGGDDTDLQEASVDSIAKDALLGEKLPSQEAYAGRTEDGKPDGDEEKDQERRQQEVENFVQEELYIHGKLLICDDRIVICGSSNINDRSQLGFHDSELSIVMEDTHALPSVMDGQEYTAGRHAATLRRMLWREHLGLLPAHALDAKDDVNAQPPGDGENEWFTGDKYDKFVEDPLSEELWDIWTKQATTNTTVFRHLFHADPDDNVKTFEEYDAFLGAQGSRKAGHIYDMFQPVDTVRQELDKIRGHLVWMPLKFLESAEMAEKGMQVNQFTESVYT